MTLQATKLILKLGGGVKLSAGQAAELAKYVSDLEALSTAGREYVQALDNAAVGGVDESIEITAHSRLVQAVRVLGEG